MAATSPAPKAQYHRAKPWEIGFFSLNNTATNIYLFAFGFITYYSTGIVGLATFTVANIMGGIRLFDGLIDPAIGVVIDKTQTKFGKYRPHMIGGNIVLILSFLLLFNIHRLDGGAKFIVFLIALLVHKIGYSFQATVTKAAQTALTNDPQQRPLFSVFDTLFSSILIFTLGQFFISNFLAPRHDGNFDLPFFNELIAIVIGVSAICTILAVIGISRKDRIEYFGLGEQASNVKIGLKDYADIFKQNRPFQSMVFAAGLMKFVATIMGDSTVMIMLFSIVLGNYGLSGRLALWVVIPNFIAIAVLSKIAGKKGLRWNYIFSVSMALVCFLGIGAILLLSDDPLQIFANGGAMAMLFSVLYVGVKIFSLYPTSLALTMAADISDYEVARSGNYASGLIGTVFSFTDSLASSLSPMVVGWIAVAIGYTDVYPQIDDPLTRETFLGALVAFVGIPTLLLITILIIMQYYPLTAAKMREVQEVISKKKDGTYAAEEYKDLF